MNKIQEQDIKEFANGFKLSNELENSTFLITGATGLIGSTLIHCLLALNIGIEIYAPLRNREKALSMFECEELKHIKIMECDLSTCDYSALDGIDHIVHCAAPTSSKFFIEKPAETVGIILDSTKRLLDYAKANRIKSFVFLSSLEVYGSFDSAEDRITEDKQGYIKIEDIRSCYPMAKRMTENLCHIYAMEYDVPVKTARLTQTTGAGISRDDNRVIAQFARLAAENKDIILHTTGESARPYCYITDAIDAILTILLKGQKGESYNVANEHTYISAKDMAYFVKENCNPNISVRIELNDNMGYAAPSKLNLSTDKIKKLGWVPKHGLLEIFRKLTDYIKSDI